MRKILMSLVITGAVISSFSTHGEKVKAAEPQTPQEVMEEVDRQLKEAENQLQDKYEEQEDFDAKQINKD